MSGAPGQGTQRGPVYTAREWAALVQAHPKAIGLAREALEREKAARKAEHLKRLTECEVGTAGEREAKAESLASQDISRDRKTVDQAAEPPGDPIYTAREWAALVQAHPKAIGLAQEALKQEKAARKDAHLKRLNECNVGTQDQRDALAESLALQDISRDRKTVDQAAEPPGDPIYTAREWAALVQAYPKAIGLAQEALKREKAARKDAHLKRLNECNVGTQDQRDALAESLALQDISRDRKTVDQAAEPPGDPIYTAREWAALVQAHPKAIGLAQEALKQEKAARKDAHLKRLNECNVGTQDQRDALAESLALQEFVVSAASLSQDEFGSAGAEVEDALVGLQRALLRSREFPAVDVWQRSLSDLESDVELCRNAFESASDPKHNTGDTIETLVLERTAAGWVRGETSRSRDERSADTRRMPAPIVQVKITGAGDRADWAAFDAIVTETPRPQLIVYGGNDPIEHRRVGRWAAREGIPFTGTLPTELDLRQKRLVRLLSANRKVMLVLDNLDEQLRFQQKLRERLESIVSAFVDARKVAVKKRLAEVTDGVRREFELLKRDSLTSPSPPYKLPLLAGELSSNSDVVTWRVRSIFVESQLLLAVNKLEDELIADGSSVKEVRENLIREVRNQLSTEHVACFGSRSDHNREELEDRQQKLALLSVEDVENLKSECGIPSGEPSTTRQVVDKPAEKIGEVWTTPLHPISLNRLAITMQVLREAATTPMRILGPLLAVFAPLMILGIANPLKQAAQGSSKGVELSVKLIFCDWLPWVIMLGGSVAAVWICVSTLLKATVGRRWALAGTIACALFVGLTLSGVLTINELIGKITVKGWLDGWGESTPVVALLWAANFAFLVPFWCLRQVRDARSRAIGTAVTLSVAAVCAHIVVLRFLKLCSGKGNVEASPLALIFAGRVELVVPFIILTGLLIVLLWSGWIAYQAMVGRWRERLRPVVASAAAKAQDLASARLIRLVERWEEVLDMKSKEFLSGLSAVPINSKSSDGGSRTSTLRENIDRCRQESMSFRRVAGEDFSRGPGPAGGSSCFSAQTRSLTATEVQFAPAGQLSQSSGIDRITPNLSKPGLP